MVAAAGRLLWKAVSKQAHWGHSGALSRAQARPFKAGGLCRGARRNQSLQLAFHLGCNQRRCREPFPAMHYAMANALQPLTVGAIAGNSQQPSTSSRTSSLDRLRPSCQRKARVESTSAALRLELLRLITGRDPSSAHVAGDLHVEWIHGPDVVAVLANRTV